MKVVLAEKPSVARELAAFLGASFRRDGYFEGRGYRVTWALGHLATLKEPHDYDPALKQWTLETLPFVPERFGLKPVSSEAARKQLKVIRRLFKEAKELICATDAGREGELIFRYVQELCGGTKTLATRLWLSSLTKSAIKDAFRRLRPLSDYDTLYAAARCRSEADWIVGLNATRYHTVRHRGESGMLWSVGRVQTPVLALIVRRDDEIRVFKSEPFWELSTCYRDVLFKFAGDRFTKEEDSQAALAKVRDRPFTITKLERKPERVRPPQLYDLTELQRDMNRRYGLSADATMRAAQELYEAKLITYPRTDSRHVGRDLKPKIPQILAGLQDSWPKEIGKLDLTALAFTARIVDDAKVSDHHAILPTGKTVGSLAPAARKVFEAIVLRLIAAFYPPCLNEVTTVEGAAEGVAFRAKGVRMLEPGWTALDPRKANDAKNGSAKNSEEGQKLPEFRRGESGPHEPMVRQGETAPPKPFTEGDLLGAMETAGKLVEDERLREALKERGLGTPATRAAVIETLLERGYILRQGKTITATDVGRYLIAIVRDPALKSPELTGDWEAKLREIERGQLKPEQFMAEIVRYAGDVVSSGSAAVDVGRLGDCPRCNRPIIEGRRAFGCSGWREGCKFKLSREQPCGSLSDDEVRQLLQRRALVRASTSGRPAVLLQLLDSGDVTEIPVPEGGQNRTTGAAPPRKSNGRRGTEAARSKGTTRPKTRRGKAAARETPDAVTLGPCPLCGSEVVERERCYGCENLSGQCRFAIWKTIAGKKIGVRAAKALLRDGRTGVIKGFTSKTGKPFEARLTLNAGEIRFEFGS